MSKLADTDKYGAPHSSRTGQKLISVFSEKAGSLGVSPDRAIDRGQHRLLSSAVEDNAWARQMSLTVPGQLPYLGLHLC